MRFGTMAVVALGLAIIALHFHGLLAAPMNDVVWGISLSQDPLGDMYYLHRFKTQIDLGCLGHDTLGSFPFGELESHITFYWTPSFIVAMLVAVATGKVVAAFNIAIMVTFFLNFLITYVALNTLLKDRLAALIPATLMSFSAYAYAHSWAHMGLMPLFYFPWFLAAFVKLQETPKVRYALGTALPLALSVYASPYYAYFILWMAVAIFLAFFVSGPRRYLQPRTIGMLGLAAVFAVLIALPYVHWNWLRDLGPTWEPQGHQDFGDDLTQIFAASARPLDYVLPNITNFLYGKFTGPLVTDVMPLRGPWSDEVPIYIGALPTLGLAAITCALLFRRGRRRLFAARPELVLSLLFIMGVAFFISMPPELKIFGLTVPMPNAWFRHLVPFRSYSRFAVVFLMALATLLGLLTQAARRQRWLAAALIAGCIFESMPETRLFPLSADAPYIKFLRERPEQVLLELGGGGHELDVERMLTGKPALNGAVFATFGLPDALLTGGIPHLDIGQFGQMGAELLVVSGHLEPGAGTAHLQLLAEFPEQHVQIWKILPGDDPRVTELFAPFKEARWHDPCHVVPKDEVIRTMQAFGRLLGS